MEGDLIRKSAAGDEHAFAELYDRHQAGVYRFVLFLSGDAATAEEITQEVFLALIRDSAKFDPARGSLQAYLFGVARNLFRRSRSRDRFTVPLEEDWASETDLAGDLAEAERIELLRHAVLALPLRYREAVTLCHIQGLSYRDAATILECSEGTVCSRLSRARALLLEKLSRKLKGKAVCMTTI